MADNIKDKTPIEILGVGDGANLPLLSGCIQAISDILAILCRPESNPSHIIDISKLNQECAKAIQDARKPEQSEPAPASKEMLFALGRQLVVTGVFNAVTDQLNEQALKKD